jgi:hypothetical protein
MNGYANRETYYFAMWYLDSLQEIHLENKFKDWQDLQEFAVDLAVPAILEVDISNAQMWAKDVITDELSKVDFRDLFDKLSNE